MRIPMWSRLILIATVLLLDRVALDASDNELAKKAADILRKNCVACHRSGNAEGGLSLDDQTGIRRGGDSGPLTGEDSSNESLLVTRVKDVDDPMPPDDNAVGAKRLTKQEIRVLERWFELGLPSIGSAVIPEPVWSPIPESFRASYAMRVSPDGNTLAVAHGNRVELRDARNGKLLQALTDPSLPQTGSADVDVIQAMAFSPLGDQLITGGFRTVRIWERVQASFGLPEVLQSAMGEFVFSPDRSEIALVNALGDVQIRNAESGEIREVVSTDSIVSSLDWTCSERLCVGQQSGEVQVVDLHTGETSATLQLDDAVAKVVQSQNGTWVAALTQSGRMTSFTDNTAREILKTWAPVSSIGFLDDKVLVVVESAGTVSLVDVSSESVLREWDHGGPVKTLAILKGSNQIVTGGGDGISKLWNAADGSLLQTFQGDPAEDIRRDQLDRKVLREKGWADHLKRHGEELKKRLIREEESLQKATESREKANAEWVEQTTKLSEIEKQISELELQIENQDATEEDAEKRVEQEKPELKKLKESQAAVKQVVQQKRSELVKRDQARQTMQQTRDRVTQAILEHERAALQHANLLQQSRRSLSDQMLRKAGHATVTAIVASTDKTLLATVHQSGTVRTYDRATGKPLGLFRVNSDPGSDRFTRAFFVGEHDLVLSGVSSLPRTVSTRIKWHLKKIVGGPNETLITDRVTALHFHPSGQSFAIGSGLPSRSGQVVVVSTHSGRPLRRFEQLHSDTVLALQYSPNGKMLATGSADKTIRLLDVQQRRVIQSLDGHTHHILSLAWKDDGRQLASGSADQTVKLWDVLKGQQTRTIGGFPEEVTAVAYVNDDSRVATACSDGLFRIHDCRNGKRVLSMNAKGDYLFTLAIGPDAAGVSGQCILAAGQNGVIHRWSVDDGKPIGDWE